MLTEADADIIKGMVARGDRQHDVAAWFGVNGGRVAEIATGARFGWVEEGDGKDLPPRGPYPAGRVTLEAMAALAAAKAALASAEVMIRHSHG